MNPIKTILIDDEPDSIETLKLMLGDHPSIEVIATFTNSERAAGELVSLQPDLVFLDVEMPVLSGFELLERLGDVNFNVVFATAYNQFALKAFRFNALDYLIKPVNNEELQQVIEKAGKRNHLHKDQLSSLKKQLRDGTITKIAIPEQTGITFIDIKDIVFVEASGNYSSIVLNSNKKLLITRNLKDIQDVLEEQSFLRIHRQYIINLNLVKSFNRNEGLLTMITGDTLPVARSQKQNLVEKYGWL